MNRFLCLLPLLSLLALPAQASVPPVVATEGVLSSTGGVPLANGSYTLTFRLYPTQLGGVAVWQETASVTVAAGRFAWELGSLTPLSAAIAAQGQWIGVQVGTEPELPRAPWRSSPFALRAQVAEGLECTGCIKSPMLDPGLLAGYALLSDLTAYVKTVDMNTLLALYVKASDLAAYAKLTDLSGLAKIADLADYVKLADLAAYAKTADLSVFAKTVDVATQLAAYAKTSDLAAYAKLTDLGAYAKTSDLAVYEKSPDLTTTLASYAKLTDLAGLAKTTDLALYAKLTDLGAYAKTSDLAAYALKTDLAAYETTAALTTALANYALKTDLSVYAKTVDVVATLTAYAKTADLAAYAKTSDLAVYALKTDLAAYVTATGLTTVLADYVKATGLAAVATTGKYSDLTGKPTLAQVGTACAVGQVVTGIAGDGSLVCGTPAVTGGTCPSGQVVTAVSANGTVSCAVPGGVPSGAIFWFAASSAPAGYLECNGAMVPRATFATLFAVVGTMYGAGDGVTTFALPDLRGQFIRGYSHGSAVDAGREFGSLQGDAFASHTHTVFTSGSQGTWGVPASGSGNGGGSSSSGAQGDVETRPKNIALLPCIKF